MNKPAMNALRTRYSRERGFTLVEMLVAMTILALLLGIVSGSLGFTAARSEAIESRILAAERIHLVHRALRQQIAGAVPVWRDEAFGDGTQQIDFEGTQAALTFVAPLRGGSNYPGLARLTLRLEPDPAPGGSGGRLWLSWRLLGDELALEAGGASDAPPDGELLVLDGLTGSSFAYAGLPAVPGGRVPEWLPNWPDRPDRGRLPDLVRLSLETAESGRAGLPDLVVALPIAAPGVSE